MTGRASPAKAAVRDKPVFAYIASLPRTGYDASVRIRTVCARVARFRRL